MNTEQVCKMIDTIVEGRPYLQSWEGSAATSDIVMDVRKSSIRFSIEGQTFDVAHPRTAREIAGALVAWANRIDPQIEKPLFGIPGEDVPGNCVTPRVWHNSTIHRRYHKAHGNCPADIAEDE
jgi:hypothetical protein